MNAIVGASITYRLALGPNAGRKALTLHTVPADDDKTTQPNELVSRQGGFSLHAGVACRSNQRKKLERVCRYITRPAIAEQRWYRSRGSISRDWIRNILFLTLRAACGCPNSFPTNLSWGVFSKQQTAQACGAAATVGARSTPETQILQHDVGTTTQARLNRAAFRIEIEKCEKCGGPVRITASIEDPDVIQKILNHLGLDQASQTQIRSPPDTLFDYSANLF